MLMLHMVAMEMSFCMLSNMKRELLYEYLRPIHSTVNNIFKRRH